VQEIEPISNHDNIQGDSVRVTKGFRLVIEFNDNPPMGKYDRRNFYWKYGIHHNAHRWLKKNFGEQCASRKAWDDENPEDGQWLYLGSQTRKRHSQKTVTLQFRTISQALLFKLTWANRL
jgi:hypothetical protein